MTIDIFSHILTHEYLAELKKSKYVRIVYNPRSAAYDILSAETGRTVAPFVENSVFTDPEMRLGKMKEYGIEKQVLCLGWPGISGLCTLVATEEETIRITKATNNGMAKIIERYSDKFIGAAELPVSSPQDAVDEVERAVKDMGLTAVQLYTQTKGVPLDSKTLYPLYEKIMKLDIPILVHPAHPPQNQFRSYEDPDLVGGFIWPYEITLAVSRVVLSGLMDNFPDLKFIFHQLGGMVPFHWSRLQGRRTRVVTGMEPKSAKTMDNFLKIFYDTAIVRDHLPALQCAYETLGARQMVFATDYPYGPEGGEFHLRACTDGIKRMNISEEDRERIFDANARGLFKL